MKTFPIASIILCVIISACNAGYSNYWTESELATISSGDAVMNVFTVADSTQEAFLRLACDTFSRKMLESEEYSRLVSRMLATVTDPAQDGVGIAGPQVGISRRIVLVQRFDKEGEPFEAYPNIRITAKRGEEFSGPEGCLSVPDCRGEVMRYRDIDVTYRSTVFGRDTTEHVEGFTAVIFQHECDHLDGILYTDRIKQ